MAGFGFSDAQEMFRREVRNFARKELSPGAKERAKMDHLPKETIRKVADMGLLGVNIPAEYGGQPADWVSWGIAIEELSAVDLAAGVLVLNVGGIVAVILKGPKEVQQEWIPPLIRGEKLNCFGITEPDAGSDVAAMKTRAVRNGDFYVINGEKTSTSVGMQADVVLLMAKTDPTKGARGISCFIIPMDSPGIVRSHIPSMGNHPVARASVMYDNVRISSKYRIGEEGEGFFIFLDAYGLIRIATALQAVGAAQASLEEAISYAKQRTAFGKPIAKFEAVSFRIAEGATLLEASRLLAYRSLWLEDQGLPHAKESAMTKWFCPEAAVKVIHDALIIHGHYGYSEELPIEQRLRDVIGCELADATADIMKIVIAQEIGGREFRPY